MKKSFLRTIGSAVTTSTRCLLGLGALVLLLAPARDSLGFSKLGQSLDLDTQRHWRVTTTFNARISEDNQGSGPLFPGWHGSELALWKGAAEWASTPRSIPGQNPDPTQYRIGDGAADFDFYFAGYATGKGSLSNVVSTVSSCDGPDGTLAYALNGGGPWDIRFCEEERWNDNVGLVPSQSYDVQSVACHEFGHALGLGHSTDSGATMWPTTGTGNESWRSINPDDVSGIQCIYGVADPLKPTITGAQFGAVNQIVVITGTNFSATGNEVWFTRSYPTLPGFDPQLKVTGVDSPDTMSITVSVPLGAGDGDVMVRTQTGLSNAAPLNLAGTPGGPFLALTGVSPSTVEALVPGIDQTVTLTGVAFTNSTTVTIDGIPLDPASYSFVDPSTITVDMPQVTQLGAVEVRVDKNGLFDTGTITVVAPTVPTLQIGNGIDDVNSNQISSSNGIDVIYAGPPGEFHYVLFSPSNVGGSIPVVTLCIGNFFLDLFEVTNGVIGPEGYNQLNIPLSPVFAVWYFQSLSFSQGKPIPTSNCQQALILF